MGLHETEEKLFMASILVLVGTICVALLFGAFAVATQFIAPKLLVALILGLGFSCFGVLLGALWTVKKKLKELHVRA